MFLQTIDQATYYNTEFEHLQKYTETSYLWEIIGVQPEAPQTILGRTISVLKSFSFPQTIHLERLINRIDHWANLLTFQRRVCLRNYVKMQHLQELADKICKKPRLIFDRMQEQKLLSRRLINSLDDLDLSIYDIRTIPSLTTLSVPHLELFEALWYNHQRVILKERFEHFISPTQALKEYSQMDDTQEIEIVTESLPQPLVIYFFKHYIDKHEELARFVVFFGSLSLNAFVSLLTILSIEELTVVRNMLDKFSEEQQRWFNDRLTEYRELFIKKNNRIKNQIDDLTREFRTIREADISPQHLEQINAYLSDILIQTEAVEKFKEILPTWCRNSDTRNLPDVILKEYAVLNARLTEREGVTPNANGCVFDSMLDKVFPDFILNSPATTVLERWGMLNSPEKERLLAALRIPSDSGLEAITQALTAKRLTTVFDLKKHKIFNAHLLLIFLTDTISSHINEIFSEVDNEDNAYEIFGHWGIINPPDYQKLGLLLNFEYTFETPPEEVFRKAFANLELIGIKTIADLKRNRIYNRHLLKGYILQQHNIDKLAPA